MNSTGKWWFYWRVWLISREPWSENSQPCYRSMKHPWSRFARTIRPLLINCISQMKSRAICIIIDHHYVDNIDYFMVSSLSFSASGWCLPNGSGTNFNGNNNTSNPIDRTVILLTPILVAMVTKIGDKKQPTCPSPSIEPAPIDWIATGKD